MSNIIEKVQAQRNYFNTGATKPIAFRKQQLVQLKALLEENQEVIFTALKKDLNKPQNEVLMAEIEPLIHEIDYMLENVEQLAQPENVESPELFQQFGAGVYESQKIYEPYGVVLNISPWNYPVQLSISPAIGAIAAGNTVVLKPSELTPHTSQALDDLIAKYFAPEYFTVIQGEVAETTALLKQKFDYIFFTGSVPVGKIIMEAASKHLTPVTLELGGKSPVIVDKTANLAEAAKSLAFAKTFNSGQTCIGPDYLFVQEEVKDEFLALLKAATEQLQGENPFANCVQIVSERHYQRMAGFLNEGKIVIGGQTQPEQRKILMTVLDDITWNDSVMHDEIFGPVLPMMTFKNIDDVIAQVINRPKPLALYYYTEDRQAEEKVLAQVSFGGGGINGAFLHVYNHHLPFGGVGDSGMGNYHGAQSFYQLSHEKAVVKRRIA
ncbi:aldehyde dehydrogenase family protein [Lonepinella sp. BR2474]|uniref:aldehyde dehydrogenase family protein n=1 Tax=Lonepinella sp. BR2474 TaxID=3434548 RepID=UPI003F6E0F98